MGATVPETATRRRVGGRMPAMIRSRVLLPDPFGPIRPSDSPRSRWTSTSRKAQTSCRREVDVHLERGESLGLIGPNGSGKSTLLRIMAGILPPSAGRVEVSGTVAPMLELGVGFHPELTGRENVYLSTSLFGLGRRQTDALYGRIVAFAELEGFMDSAVKTFSTGMAMRLGFAVA